jgi:hypothetical protein
LQAVSTEEAVMKRHRRKLALSLETLRALSPRALALPRGGVPNYNTSIDHKGCSGPTVAADCFSVGLSFCGPCYES